MYVILVFGIELGSTDMKFAKRISEKGDLA
jgi:hypothetical protein